MRFFLLLLILHNFAWASFSQLSYRYPAPIDYLLLLKYKLKADFNPGVQIDTCANLMAENISVSLGIIPKGEAKPVYLRPTSDFIRWFHECLENKIHDLVQTKNHLEYLLGSDQELGNKNWDQLKESEKDLVIKILVYKFIGPPEIFDNEADYSTFHTRLKNSVKEIEPQKWMTSLIYSLFMSDLMLRF